MTIRNISHYLTHPVFTARRIAYKLYEWSHPHEPWIAQGAVRFCAKHLRANMRGLEWGSGRSTAWFAKRLLHLVSVEHHDEWHKKVSKDLLGQGVTNVDYRLVSLNHPVTAPTVPHYEVIPDYVNVINEFVDESFDLVIVDGHYRQACVLAAMPKLKHGGYLLLDNSNWLPRSEWHIDSRWTMVHRSDNVMTETTVWQKP